MICRPAFRFETNSVRALLQLVPCGLFLDPSERLKPLWRNRFSLWKFSSIFVSVLANWTGIDFVITSTVCPAAIPPCRPDATPFNLIKYEFFTCIGNSSLFNGHFSFQNFHWTQSPTASHLAHAVNGHRAWLWRILWGPETQLNSRIRRKGLPRIIFSTDNNFPLLRANADLEYYYSSR